MDGAGFDRRGHFGSGGQMQIFERGTCDDGGERKCRVEIDANELAH